MRFLVDECTGTRTAKWLQDRGHEVFSVYDDARGADDEMLIQKALDEDWILITNDKDFGEKIVREKYRHCGIIFLRLSDNRSDNKIDVLHRLLENYADKVPNQFVVVTETQVRFAKQ